MLQYAFGRAESDISKGVFCISCDDRGCSCTAEVGSCSIVSFIAKFYLVTQLLSYSVLVGMLVNNVMNVFDTSVLWVTTAPKTVHRGRGSRIPSARHFLTLPDLYLPRKEMLYVHTQGSLCMYLSLFDIRRYHKLYEISYLII